MKKPLTATAWQPVSEAPYGIPVQVRDAAGAEAVAIRDPYVQWFNEDRSGGLPFEPTEFSPLPGGE